MNAHAITETPAPDRAPSSPPASVSPWRAGVAVKARDLSFGTVQIAFHDPQVVQVERLERTRLELSKGGSRH